MSLSGVGYGFSSDCDCLLFSAPVLFFIYIFFFFKQKTAYEMPFSDWSSDVCSSDLRTIAARRNFTAKWLNARLARYSTSDGELRFSMMAADEPLDFTEANLDLAVRLLDGPGEHEGVRLGEAVFVTVGAAGGGPEHKVDWPRTEEGRVGKKRDQTLRT